MKTLFLTLCIAVMSFVYSQDSKFGKVTVEELESTQYNLDPEAGAAILCQKDYVYMNGNMRTYTKESYMKIKIYDKDKAEKYLSKTLRMYKNGGTFEKIFGFKGVTYNLENGKIIEDKISKEAIVKDEYNKYNNTLSFTFPNVKNGSILEYKYTFDSPYLGYIDEIYFQYSIPLIFAEYIFEAPEFMNYDYIPVGFIQPSSHRNENKQWNVDYSAKMETFEFTNVPANVKEKFVINFDNSRPSIAYELKGITIPGYVYENYSKSWDAVFKNLDERPEFGGQLKFSSNFQDQVNEITQSQTSDLGKMSSILSYVQNTIKWNGFFGVNTENGVKKAFKEKVGNVADVNFILIDMLKAAGLDAYPFVLSSVGNGYVNPAHPSLNKFNYVIAAVRDKDKVYLMDATSSFSGVNLLPKRCLTVSGYLLNGRQYYSVPIMNSQMSRELENIQAKIEGNTIKGMYKKIVNNYFAMDELEDYNENKQEFEKNLRSEYNTNISNLDIQFEKDKFTTQFDFQESNDLEVVGNKILISPLLFLKNDTQIFNESSRKNNLEFGTPFKDSNSISIEIPEGYTVEELPKSVAFEIPNNAGSYLFRIEESQNNTIRVFTEVTINSAILPPAYYDILKELWQKRIEAETQYISLVKN